MKLRYHHLMCIPRFKGEGYSKAFCDNLDNIKKSFENGDAQLVLECDDVCRCCPNNIGGVCCDEEKVIRYDRLVKECLEKGEKPQPQDICSDCRWYKICRYIEV